MSNLRVYRLSAALTTVLFLVAFASHGAFVVTMAFGGDTYGMESAEMVHCDLCGVEADAVPVCNAHFCAPSVAASSGQQAATPHRLHARIQDDPMGYSRALTPELHPPKHPHA